MTADPYAMYACISMSALKAMNGIRGKLGAQTGHAFMHAFWDAEERFPGAALAYKTSQMAFKIVLAVPDDSLLETLLETCRPICGVTLVKDAARTVFTEPTITGVGIGPILKSARPEILLNLRPLS